MYWLDNYRNYTDLSTELIKSVLLNETIDIDLSKTDIHEFIDFIHMHKIENLVYTALLQMGVKFEGEWQRLEQYYLINTDVALKQDYYLNELCVMLEENRIWYMPLKGSILKNIYPSIELRQSADIDILFDASFASRVRELMEKQGFVTDLFGTDQDVYILNKTVCVEMHRTLLPEHSRWYDFVNKLVQRTSSKNGLRYEMTLEDFYLFNIIHIAKHASEGGIGIRAVTDIWLYLNTYKDELDYDKINEGLTEINLTEFESNIRAVASYWFDGESADEKTLFLEQYLVISGWNGNIKQKTALVSESYVKEKKVKYYFKYIFKSADEMKYTYKYLQKCPFLFPIAWIQRIYSAVFVRKGAVKSFLHRYDGIDGQYINDMKDFMTYIGL